MPATRALALFVSLTLAAWAAPAVSQVGPGFGPDINAQASSGTPVGTAGEDAQRGSRLEADLGTDMATEAAAGTPLGAPPRTALIDPNAQPAQGRGLGVELQPVVALAGVLALIFVLAWVFKRVAAKSGSLGSAIGAGGKAPAGLVEVLARYPLASKQTLVVLRFDRRILLCSMVGGGRGSASSMTTLCELDNAEDVASVLLKSRDQAGESIARSFERSMQQAEEGFAGSDDYEYSPTVEVPRPRVRATTINEEGDRADLWTNRPPPGALQRGLDAIRRREGA